MLHSHNPPEKAGKAQGRGNPAVQGSYAGISIQGAGFPGQYRVSFHIEEPA
jgi:hypothetical protein